MHTIAQIDDVTITSYASGTTANFSVDVYGIEQPSSTSNGTVSVEFNGETVDAPIKLTFAENLKPTATVALADPRVTVELSAPTITPSGWRFNGTITVV